MTKPMGSSPIGIGSIARPARMVAGSIARPVKLAGAGIIAQAARGNGKEVRLAVV